MGFGGYVSFRYWLRAVVKEIFCVHDWQPIPLSRISPYIWDECTKCKKWRYNAESRDFMRGKSTKKEDDSE